MMMRILDKSGYRCLRDLEWEKKLGQERSNDYFYEHQGFVHTGDMSLLEGYDAAKVMPKGLSGLDPLRVIVIWMDREKDAVVASQASYGRDKMIGKDLGEDYDQWDVPSLLAPFIHVRLAYEAVASVPTVVRHLTAQPSYPTHAPHDV
jgi:hypothetical protein